MKERLRHVQGPSYGIRADETHLEIGDADNGAEVILIRYLVHFLYFN